MKIEGKWTSYLGLGLLSFAAVMLELFSIFVIERMLLHIDIANYTTGQRSLHSVITACLWAVVILSVLVYSRRRYHYPEDTEKSGRIPSKDWKAAWICLLLCKVMTFIDWHTLKIIGESRGQSLSRIVTQYIYYIFEVGLVLLIILYGQKAAEVLLERESSVPFGGILLALTWGMFHFISRGVGIEWWNGISCIIFSLLSGLMYLKLKRRPICSYLMIAVGYLL
ncbi:hypothetical protein [Dorea sp. D27]|uniref:hypothetical protein n=1 Tax=Dorea sp. D27 TaxID=658665 RepID=UPI000673B224|nr:hypothetical protein [Dorea sp. D27]KMZ55600.1 hypothetical protein HMPREF0980_00298 [Dorea sp. D27]